MTKTIIGHAAPPVKIDRKNFIAGDGEPLTPLGQAAPLFPAPPSASSLHRWATIGLRGVVLSTVRVGAKRYTTRRQVADFLSELNA